MPTYNSTLENSGIRYLGKWTIYSFIKFKLLEDISSTQKKVEWDDGKNQRSALSKFGVGAESVDN